MELVYLWVEKYKNIENEGFNFSPRFRCEYDKDTQKLDIVDKEETGEFYPKNFFGDNINVTAIVGENGSGKSGLLESFMLTIFNHSNHDMNLFSVRGFCIFYKEKEFYFKLTPNFFQSYSSQFIDKNNFLKGECDNNTIMMMHYNYSLDMLSSKFKNSLIANEYDGHIYDYETTPNNLFSQPKKYNSQINIQQTNRETQKYMIKSKQEYGEENIRKIFSDTFRENRNIQFIPHSFILHFDYTNYLEKFTNTSIRKLINNYFREDTFDNIDIEQLTKLSYVFFVFQLYSIYTLTPRLFNRLNGEYIRNQNIVDLLNLINSQDNIYDTLDNTIEEFRNIIEGNSLIAMLGTEIKSTFPSIYETAWYIDYIKGNLGILKKHDVNLFKEKTTIDISLIEELIKNLPSFIEIELYNKEDISFSDLSFGEKTTIRLSYNIMFFLNFYSIKRKIFYILLDEIDLGLHPEWQKKFFNFILVLIDLISKMLDIRVTIFISSHSPFILSDLPKENVIFLKSGTQDNPNIQQTFGANIHTLLSHGFFMSDGLMGEFAKWRINDVYNFLIGEQSNVKTKEEAENIINLVGEPLIKRQLEDVYNKKFQLKSKDEIIQELQNKIAQLEKSQNDKN